MSVYIITYNLNAPTKEYLKLFDEIKKFENWWHYIPSSWLIFTNDSVSDVFSKIKDHFSEGDRFLIIEVTNKYTGWLPKGAWDWISKYIT